MEVEIHRLRMSLSGMEWKDMVLRIRDVYADLLQPPSALVFISAERLRATPCSGRVGGYQAGRVCIVLTVLPFLDEIE